MQASMITNKIGDMVPGLVVGQGIYRVCIARGISEELHGSDGVIRKADNRRFSKGNGGGL